MCVLEYITAKKPTLRERNEDQKNGWMDRRKDQGAGAGGHITSKTNVVKCREGVKCRECMRYKVEDLSLAKGRESEKKL